MENKFRHIQYSLNCPSNPTLFLCPLLSYLCSICLIFLIHMLLPWNRQTPSRLDPDRQYPMWGPQKLLAHIIQCPTHFLFTTTSKIVMCHLNCNLNTYSNNATQHSQIFKHMSRWGPFLLKTTTPFYSSFCIPVPFEVKGFTKNSPLFYITLFGTQY